jgi:hypothetical protein
MTKFGFTEDDWVGIRMIYLLCAYDPNMARHPEVKKAMDFYLGKIDWYPDDLWPRVFDLLKQDNGWRGTFTELGYKLNRQLSDSITIKYRGEE